MGKVIAGAAMSLDGFIADTSDAVGPLFDFYGNGDVELTGADPDRVFRTTAATAGYLRTEWGNIGATVIGRRLFDLTNGWGGRPAVGDAVFVVTHRAPADWPHPDAPFTFVTDGLPSAIAQAQAFAQDRNVAITAGDLTGQAIAAGLVDEVSISAVPPSPTLARFHPRVPPRSSSTGRLYPAQLNPGQVPPPKVLLGPATTHPVPPGPAPTPARLTWAAAPAAGGSAGSRRHGAGGGPTTAPAPRQWRRPPRRRPVHS
jgi:dihydrofolate reductase